MRRIAHLSDLHCPPERAEQADQLVAAVVDAQPDLIIVTGDLTRRGRRHEFDSARRLLDRLPGTHLIVPGNHDVPVLNVAARLASPFGRFHERIAVSQPALFCDSEIAVVGLNTARGVQARLNWSRGVASENAVRKSLGFLAQAESDAVRILVSHHPIVPDLRDLNRSATRGARRALTLANQHRVAILMHGHLHRARAEAIVDGPLEMIVIGAGTALSERERDEPACFNIVEVQRDALQVREMRVDDNRYEPGRTWSLPLPSFKTR
jgi:3',5'-cyclic AMP phosphodiesterase CpdA